MKPKYYALLNELPEIKRRNIEVYQVKEMKGGIYSPLTPKIRDNPCVICVEKIQSGQEMEWITYRKRGAFPLPYWECIHAGCLKEIKRKSRLSTPDAETKDIGGRR